MPLWRSVERNADRVMHLPYPFQNGAFLESALQRFPKRVQTDLIPQNISWFDTLKKHPLSAGILAFATIKAPLILAGIGLSALFLHSLRKQRPHGDRIDLPHWIADVSHTIDRRPLLAAAGCAAAALLGSPLLAAAGVMAWAATHGLAGRLPNHFLGR